MTAPLRVLHCPVNTAGIPWANSQALRRRGVESDLLVFNRYKLHPGSGHLARARTATCCGSRLTQWRAFLKLLPRYDVFHFYSSVTLVPKSVQFRILHALGKKGVYQYLGSDIRGKTREQLAYGLAADAEIVSSYDAIRWVPDAEMILPGRRGGEDRARDPERREAAAADPPRTVVAAAQGHASTSSPRSKGSMPTSGSSKG